MIEGFNLILVMERNQKEALKTAFRNKASRIYLLSEMIGKTFEIVDPISGTLADFNATATEIDNILTEGFPIISQLSAE
jgi:protein-tyrosine-phosphatase